MKDEHTLLLLDYLEGRLSEEDKNKLSDLVQSGVISRDEINRLKAFYLHTESFDTPEPSPQMRGQFYANLHAEQEKQSRFPREKLFPDIQFDIKLSQLTYGFLIFLLGLMIGLLVDTNRGYEQQMMSLKAELHQMQESMVVNLLEQPSATQRLKAVSMSTEMQGADEKVIASLVRVLNEDSHVNVRLAALDALLIYAGRPEVREGLIRSIPGQEAPMVQLALAQAMVELEEKRSIDALQQLLEQEDLNDMVAKEVRKSISVLS
jgi:hypothetical protein